MTPFEVGLHAPDGPRRPRGAAEHDTRARVHRKTRECPAALRGDGWGTRVAGSLSLSLCLRRCLAQLPALHPAPGRAARVTLQGASLRTRHLFS